MTQTVTMAHGSGGAAYRELVEEVFLPAFHNEYIAPLTDSAILEVDAVQARAAQVPRGDDDGRVRCAAVVLPGRGYRQARRLRHGERPCGFGRNPALSLIGNGDRGGLSR